MKVFKKINLFVFSIFLCQTYYCQNVPIDFEPNGYGLNWTWTTFENNSNPPLELVANPDTSGINNSSTVAKFTALQAGNPWAGFESMHGTDIGSFSLNSTNCTVRIMVWKSVISDVGIKFVDANSAAQPEIKVPNTLINQWEELIFDFSSRIGVFPQLKDQIVIFPDFDLAGRSQDNIIYIDNIYDTGNNTTSISNKNKISFRAFPNPTNNQLQIEIENYNGNFFVQLYDFTGKLIQTTNKSSIYLKDHPKGIYLLKVVYGDKIEQIKVIKE